MVLIIGREYAASVEFAAGYKIKVFGIGRIEHGINGLE
jgi:hypothetical protein